MINDFKSLFKKNSALIKNDLIVGLSGGPDSIFLLYYIKSLKEHFGFLGSVTTIIVDHGLRVESKSEAFKTKKIATKLGFFSKIVKIYGLLLQKILKFEFSIPSTISSNLSRFPIA